MKCVVFRLNFVATAELTASMKAALDIKKNKPGHILCTDLRDKLGPYNASFGFHAEENGNGKLRR